MHSNGQRRAGQYHEQSTLPYVYNRAGVRCVGVSA
jgi:hypothetical protein